MIKILINKYKDKALICLLVGIIAILAISAVSPANAINTTIDNTTVGGLYTAIDNSSNGDTITLKNGIYYGNNNRGITIDHNLKIVGESKNNVILDAQGKKNFFDISSGINVTLINLTFKNGYKGHDDGGAIYNKGSLIVTNVNFIDNYATYYGGAIYNYGVLTMNNANFINNSATWSGAIYNYGVLTMNNTNFINNTMNTDFNNHGGGAIFNSGTLLMFNSTFINNSENSYTSYVGGGAIYNDGNLTSINSTFINNMAINEYSYTGGGAIYNKGNFNLINSVFINNTAKEDGGAIYNDGSLNIISSIFINNMAKNEGGAIYNSYSLNIINSNFTDNNANYGGAIYNGYTNNLTAIDSTFTNNKANYYGSDIYGYYNLINNSKFINSNEKNVIEVNNTLKNSWVISKASISMTVKKNGKNGNYSSTVTITLSQSDMKLKNASVRLYNGNKSISTKKTNSNGQIIFDLPSTSKSYTITAEVNGQTITQDTNNFSFADLSAKATINPGNLKLGSVETKDGNYNIYSFNVTNNGNYRSASGYLDIQKEYYDGIKEWVKNIKIPSLNPGQSTELFSYSTKGIGTVTHYDSFGRPSYTTLQYVYTPVIKEGSTVEGVQPPAKAKVSANYKTGRYNKDIKVVLTATKGTIYYKIGNGNYKKYTKSIAITKTSKIRFYAVHRDGNSAVSTYTYTIVKKPKITYFSKDSVSGRQITKKFTIKNKGSAKGSLSWTFKIPSSFKYVKAIASSISYYKYNKVSKILTFGVKNLGAGKSTTIKAIFTKKK